MTKNPRFILRGQVNHQPFFERDIFEVPLNLQDIFFLDDPTLPNKDHISLYIPKKISEVYLRTARDPSQLIRRKDLILAYCDFDGLRERERIYANAIGTLADDANLTALVMEKNRTIPQEEVVELWNRIIRGTNPSS